MYVKTEDKMVTPEEAKENELPIDGTFYINKQIATQVDDVLSVIGLRKLHQGYMAFFL